MTRFVICSKVSLKPAALCLSHPCSGVFSSPDHPNSLALVDSSSKSFSRFIVFVALPWVMCQIGVARVSTRLPAGSQDVMYSSNSVQLLSSWISFLSCNSSNNCPNASSSSSVRFEASEPSNQWHPDVFVSSFQFFGQQEHFFLSLCPFSAVSKHRPFLVFNQVSISHNTLISFHLLCGFAWVHCS